MRTLVIALTLAATAASAQTKRAATFEDVLNIKAVQAPQLSPDGRTVIYTVRQWVDEQDKKEARTHIWRVPADGSSPARQITFGDKGDTLPQFSPDGKLISFVSARGGAEAKGQIYVMSLEGGEAWKLTDAKESVQSYIWAPDSVQIAYVSVDPRSAEDEANIKKRDDERVFEGDFRYSHIWVIDVNTKQARRVTEGTSWTVQGVP
jgi:Tol biopolymer transport system component